MGGTWGFHQQVSGAESRGGGAAVLRQGQRWLRQRGRCQRGRCQRGLPVQRLSGWVGIPAHPWAAVLTLPSLRRSSEAWHSLPRPGLLTRAISLALEWKTRVHLFPQPRGSLPARGAGWPRAEPARGVSPGSPRPPLPDRGDSLNNSDHLLPEMQQD